MIKSMNFDKILGWQEEEKEADGLGIHLYAIEKSRLTKYSILSIKNNNL